MYAILRTGSHQYRVAAGDTISVERLDVPEGEKIELAEILLVGDNGKVRVGTPLVDGAKVRATVLGEAKGKKLTVFKYKPKNRYRVRTGHRQKHTRLMIDAIEV
jgi:large subunit ribosomal protein L21